MWNWYPKILKFRTAFKNQFLNHTWFSKGKIVLSSGRWNCIPNFEFLQWILWFRVGLFGFECSISRFRAERGDGFETPISNLDIWFWEPDFKIWRGFWGLDFAKYEFCTIFLILWISQSHCFTAGFAVHKMAFYFEVISVRKAARADFRIYLKYWKKVLRIVIRIANSNYLINSLSNFWL